MDNHQEEDVIETDTNVNEILIKQETKQEGSQPYIDHLLDATYIDELTGMRTFIPRVGENVVIERNISSAWFDTKIYEIRKIDHVTGKLMLHDNEWQHHAMSNFKTGIERGYRFKLSPKDGRLRKKNKVLKKQETEKKKEPKKGNPGQPGLRRIYETKGIIHTRLKGKAFGPEGESNAVDGDKVSVTKPDHSGKVTVTHPEKGWTEVWDGLKI